MAKKRKKEKRLAAVNEHQILIRDLRATTIWAVIAMVVVGALGVVRYTLF